MQGEIRKLSNSVWLLRASKWYWSLLAQKVSTQKTYSCVVVKCAHRKLFSTLVFLPNVARNFAISTSYLFTLFVSIIYSRARCHCNHRSCMSPNWNINDWCFSAFAGENLVSKPKVQIQEVDESPWRRRGPTQHADWPAPAQRVTSTIGLADERHASTRPHAHLFTRPNVSRPQHWASHQPFPSTASPTTTTAPPSTTTSPSAATPQRWGTPPTPQRGLRSRASGHPLARRWYESLPSPHAAPRWGQSPWVAFHTPTRY